MARERSSRYAVLDLDETLIEGTLGTRIVKALLDPRKTRGIIPRKYYLKALRYTHLPLLARFKRFYRVYRYLLHRTFNLYLDLLRDPRVDREGLRKILEEVVDGIEIPEVTREFLEKLRTKGYTLVLLSASPQELAERMGKRLGVDVVIGSREGMVMDRENKEKVIRELAREGRVEIIVGNPGNEPFWLAERFAIVVRSPNDLRKWLPRI